MFRRAEGAVEAWSLLAQQAGQRSAVQSDFTKLAFLDHPDTDTQAAIWRANAGRRIVIAFRGTEQVRILAHNSVPCLFFLPPRLRQSDFTKLAFLDHPGTDTHAAIWRANAGFSGHGTGKGLNPFVFSFFQTDSIGLRHSNFTKLAFLDHPESDTQAAIWRANAGRRIVVAFRGTEQVRLLAYNSVPCLFFPPQS